MGEYLYPPGTRLQTLRFACDPGDPLPCRRYVIKTYALDDDMQQTFFRANAYFLAFLAPTKLAVPLVSDYTCVDESTTTTVGGEETKNGAAAAASGRPVGIIVTPAFETDMYKTGVEAASRLIRPTAREAKDAENPATRSLPTLAFTIAEFRRMFEMAQGLDDQGIIHGDLKPDQYLRNAAGQLFLNDFDTAGFAPYVTVPPGGFEGAPLAPWAPRQFPPCPDSLFTDLQNVNPSSPLTSQAMRRANVWQLQLWCLFRARVLVYNQSYVTLFGGFRDLAPVHDAYRSVCPSLPMMINDPTVAGATLLPGVQGLWSPSLLELGLP